MSQIAYKIVFFGMGGVYSLLPLRALLENGAQVAAVFFARPESTRQEPRWLPRAAAKDPQALVVLPETDSIISAAGEFEVPVLEVGELESEALSILRELSPDLIVTACFPRLLPQEWLETPRLGCLNIHPSLLPAYQGRYPLFWQFRAGEHDTGVTLHLMDTGVDTGDIVAQKGLTFPEGVTAWNADKLAAEAGAELLVDVLAKPKLSQQPQPSAGASYQGIPTEADRTIPTSWPVRRAFNFLRGADDWAPFWIEMEDGERLEVNRALGFELDAELDAYYENIGEEKRVQMEDGVLRVK
ncbi:MAG: hypothetical protein FVQ83_16830 [Chloroflexi bacterium]|nr:hypothetical protein [Chloroflexota bacterium]